MKVAPPTEAAADARLAGMAAVDSIYFLMYDGWHDELESNRWHYARRWARHVPVILLQPGQRIPRRQDAAAATAIDNCEVLPVMAAGGPDAYALGGLVQAARVMEHMAERGHRRPLLWSYNPWLAALYAAVPAVARVYHATENHFDYKGMPDFFHLELEAALRISDLVIAVSSGVADGVRARVPDAQLALVTNGCDTSQYQPAGTPSESVAAARDGFERVAAFAGNINDRIDFELVLRAAVSNESTLIVFAGPIGPLGDHDTKTWRRVLRLQNVRHFGRMTASELAALYRSADLGFIPYRREPRIVRNGFPLKTLEMAATGLPVVASRMQPIVGLAAAIVVAEEDEQFLDSFSSLSRGAIGEEQRLELLEAAAANDYDRKFEQVVAGVASSIPADRKARTKLDDLMLVLGHDPWRASCTRIFDRFKASPLRPLAFAYGMLSPSRPAWSRRLVPAALRDRLRNRSVG
jgi:glycosyltransferase involved in cell wall biosynthesis